MDLDTLILDLQNLKKQLTLGENPLVITSNKLDRLVDVNSVDLKVITYNDGTSETCVVIH